MENTNNNSVKIGAFRVNANGKKERLTPIRINQETVEENAFSKDEIHNVRIGYRKYPCILEWLPEEWYAEYLRMEWAEIKAEEREKRCLLSDNMGGFIMCPECFKCYECEKRGSIEFDSFLPASIETLQEDADFDITDGQNEMEDLVWEKIRDDTEKYLEGVDPECAGIFTRYFNNMSQTDIAKELGIPIGSVGYKIKKMQKLAQEFLELID